MSPPTPALEVPQIAWRDEIVDAWRPLFVDALPTLCGLVVVGFISQLVFAVVAARAPRVARVLPALLTVVAVGIGLKVALDKASLFDDAHITFRYARNLVEGHGLVWNIGERVEGYTNFLWTVLIAFGVWFFQVDARWIGLVFALIAFAVNLVVIARLARSVSSSIRPAVATLPFAALLLAVQDTFTEYGTSGLETGFASLLVNVGVLVLVERTTVRASFVAGLVLILAVLTRPDHSLFYAVGALVVFVTHAPNVWRARSEGPRAMWRAGVSSMIAYAAPFTIYLAYLAWKLSYYGSIVPNTYYAKSANLSYWVQGDIYGRVFLAQSHFWIVVPIFLVVAPFAFRASERARRFVLCALPSTIAYAIYVAKVGGDFMHGRFYVTLLPLVVVGALLAPDVFAGRALFKVLTPGVALASLVFVIGNALPFFVDETGRWFMKWHIAPEGLVYPIVSFDPLTVDHGSEVAGKVLGRLEAKGIRPRLALSGIGLVGYHSRLDVFDVLGLTDANVARQPLTRRERPGHEKFSTMEHLEAWGPHFVREANYIPHPYRRLVEMNFGPRSGRAWSVFRYDRTLMNRIRRENRDIALPNIEAHLDAEFKKIDSKGLAEVERDFAFFKRLYFDVNNDPLRRSRIEKWIEDKRRPTPTEVPGERRDPR